MRSRLLDQENIVGLTLGKWTVESLCGQKIHLICGDEEEWMSLGRFRCYWQAGHEENNDEETS